MEPEIDGLFAEPLAGDGFDHDLFDLHTFKSDKHMNWYEVRILTATRFNPGEMQGMQDDAVSFAVR